MSDNVKEINGKTYAESDDVKRVAEAVIAKRSLNLQNARVRYVEVGPKISKGVAAVCKKASPFAEFFGDCDYTISVSQDLWKLLTEEVKEILVYHELLHIKTKMTRTGDIKYCVRDHNVKDFKNIIDQHGIDWCNTMYDQMLKTLDEKEKLNFDDMKW